MLAIAPPNKKEIINYSNWLEKRKIPFHILNEYDNINSYSMLMLCGGPDIGKNKLRDELEIKWFNDAYRKIPVIGICRGLQLVNIILNGTLYEDLSDELIMHSTDKNSISNEPSSNLNSSFHNIIYNNFKIEVNSRHHQGIKVLGEGLKPLAYSEGDNLIEMIKGFKSLFVQWHPEREEVYEMPAERIVSLWIEKFMLL